MIKTVADSGTPELLGAETLHFLDAIFIGKKSESENNTGAVTIQIQEEGGTWRDAITIAAGEEYPWFEGNFPASEFRLKVANNGDGVLVIYHRI